MMAKKPIPASSRKNKTPERSMIAIYSVTPSTETLPYSRGKVSGLWLIKPRQLFARQRQLLLSAPGGSPVL